MTITSEDAVNSLISDEIESESVTEAIASASMIVVPVDTEMATNPQPGPPDEGGIPCEEPCDPSTEEEPDPKEPEPEEHR